MRRLPLLLLCVSRVLMAQPGTESEPVRYTGPIEIDLAAHDGGLRPAVGTASYQVLRANRSRPDLSDRFGWTYNHQPMLAYWNGRFYIEYASNETSEPTPPGHNMLARSTDGKGWDIPEVVFPKYQLPSGEYLLPHQRMGFYVAPNGRLLVIGAFIYAPWPRAGAVGRLVREVYPDGTFGPIYFIRYNRHKGWHEGNTRYPLYRQSEDEGFVDACERLLGDKLMTQQWWEEDRGADSPYALKGEMEALSFYRRKDGHVVGLWKNALAGLSRDGGQSWSTPVKLPTFITDGAKSWGQRTKDGRYAILYNPVNDGAHRWPLAIITGEDGVLFDGMLLVHGEVPERRYYGTFKDWGPQYVRGIVEGNGDPPGNAIWVTYSVNKEDIWVSRVPLPVRGTVDKPVNDTFDGIPAGGHIPDWNIYSPKWAPVNVVEFPGKSNKSLKLTDREPYDYCKAVRVFRVSKVASIAWRLLVEDPARGDLEVEVLDQHGRRPVRLMVAANRTLKTHDGARWVDAHPYKPGVWHSVRVAVDAAGGFYRVSVDGAEVVRKAAFAEPAASVERLSFRTGPFRAEPTRAHDRFYGSDLPGADAASESATYYIDDVLIR